MTREDIIRMAREAGFAHSWSDAAGEALERFASMVAEAEREECALLLETYGLALCHGDRDMQRNFERTRLTRKFYAAAIRARGKA